MAYILLFSYINISYVFRFVCRWVFRLWSSGLRCLALHAGSGCQSLWGTCCSHFRVDSGEGGSLVLRNAGIHLLYYFTTEKTTVRTFKFPESQDCLEEVKAYAKMAFFLYSLGRQFNPTPAPFSGPLSSSTIRPKGFSARNELIMKWEPFSVRISCIRNY
jgi:hypothetical protein